MTNRDSEEAGSPARVAGINSITAAAAPAQTRQPKRLGEIPRRNPGEIRRFRSLIKESGFKGIAQFAAVLTGAVPGAGL